MSVEITLRDRSVAELNKFPDTCPFCHRGTDPTNITSDNSLSELQVIFRCTYCKKLFIGYYIRTGRRTYGPSSNTFHYELNDISIGNPAKQNFSNGIEVISSEFVKLYTQSASAEYYKLKDIAGTGYRKSLEFLIKDFAIKLNPDKSLEIKKKFLANVIEDFVDSKRIKATAQRAAWLGNDEAHYERKWLDKDLKDLKLLINMVVAYIQTEHNYEEIVGSMNGKK